MSILKIAQHYRAPYISLVVTQDFDKFYFTIPEFLWQYSSYIRIVDPIHLSRFFIQNVGNICCTNQYLYENNVVSSEESGRDFGAVAIQQVGRVSDPLFTMMSEEEPWPWPRTSRQSIPHTVASVPHLHYTDPRCTLYCGIASPLLRPLELSRYSDGLLARRSCFVSQKGKEISIFWGPASPTTQKIRVISPRG